MATASNSGLGTVLLAGDLAGSTSATSPELTPTGVKPGAYEYATVTVDAKGRVLYAESTDLLPTVPCAGVGQCGIVKVGKNHNIVNTDGEISLKKASETEYGVVLIGEGLEENASGQIQVDFIEATPSVLGVVTVPTSGNLKVDSSGNLTVPVASTSTRGVVRVAAGGGLEFSSGTASYVPPKATATDAGYVTVGQNITASNGTISIPTASASEAGLFRMGSEFKFTGQTYSCDTIATTSTIGLVKAGTGIVVDADGTIHRGIGSITTTSKGTVQVATGNGLSITGGVLSWSTPTASTTVKGGVQFGTHFVFTPGELNIEDANGTATKGVVFAASTGNLEIENGLIDVGPNVVRFDRLNVFTKAQVTALKTITFSSTIAPDLSQSNVHTVTLTGNATLAAPTNMVNGGQYIIIVKQDATGGRQLTLDPIWKTPAIGGNNTLTRQIATGPSAISVINITIVDSVPYAQIENGFA